MKRKDKRETAADIPELVAEPEPETLGEKAKRLGVCEVCGAESAPTSVEPLCWVCRRLKISAWRDGDQQAAAQE